MINSKRSPQSRGLLDMSKPEDRREAANILADYGRNGDTMVAHINPTEARTLKAMGGSGTVNPRTGLLEFADMDGQGTTESGAVGGGVSTDPGYGSVDTFGGSGVTTPGEQLADAIARGDVIDFSAPIGGQSGGQIVDLSPEDQDAINKGGLFSPGFFSDPFGYLGDRAKSFAAGLRDAPLTTLGNTALTFASPIYSAANIMHGLLNSQNPNANLMADIMSGIGNHTPTPDRAPASNGADDNPNDAPPDGFASDSRGGGGEGAAPYRPQVPTPQQTAQQIAQQALRQAAIQPPQAYNSWAGNQFTIGTEAGRPRAYNWWDGNQFRMPSGLLG